MTEKILVAYATKHGSTTEIAERIGESLREAGLETDVLPAALVVDLEPYRAVILGSAIYVGHWREEAVRFLHMHEKELAERPVWLFSSGPASKGDPVGLLRGWRFPTGLQSVAERIHPREVVVFHGHIDRDKLDFLERLLVGETAGLEQDLRDWAAISSWGRKIAAELSTEPKD